METRATASKQGHGRNAGSPLARTPRDTGAKKKNKNSNASKSVFIRANPFYQAEECLATDLLCQGCCQMCPKRIMAIKSLLLLELKAVLKL